MGQVSYCYEEALNNAQAIMNVVEQRLSPKGVAVRGLMRTAKSELRRAKTRFGERVYIIAYRDRPHLEPHEFEERHRELRDRAENMFNDFGLIDRVLFTFDL